MEIPVFDAPSIMIVAGSAGSLVLIYQILEQLTEDLQIPVLVVIHHGRGFKSHLNTLLQKHCKLPVIEACDKEPLLPGTVFLAPPDYHLLVENPGQLALDGSEPVHYCRPAIDLTLFSAADVFGSKVIAVLLSGANEDGAAGAAYVESAGGAVIVQDPVEAEVRTMPAAVLNRTSHALKLGNSELLNICRQYLPKKL